MTGWKLGTFAVVVSCAAAGLESEPVALITHDLGAPDGNRIIGRVERGELAHVRSEIEELFGCMGVARGDEELVSRHRSEGADDFGTIPLCHRLARRAFHVERKQAPGGTLVRERVDETAISRPAKGLEDALVERRRDTSNVAPVP